MLHHLLEVLHTLLFHSSDVLLSERVPGVDRHDHLTLRLSVHVALIGEDQRLSNGLESEVGEAVSQTLHATHLMWRSQ